MNETSEKAASSSVRSPSFGNDAQANRGERIKQESVREGTEVQHDIRSRETKVERLEREGGHVTRDADGRA